MTKPLTPAVKAERAEARLLARLDTPAELDANFEDLLPGATLVYWRGESLGRECQDWRKSADLPKESCVVKLRRVRNWASAKHADKLGMLTQKKDGDLFDYRITKQKGPTRWQPRHT